MTPTATPNIRPTPAGMGFRPSRIFSFDMQQVYGCCDADRGRLLGSVVYPRGVYLRVLTPLLVNVTRGKAPRIGCYRMLYSG